MKEIQLTQGKIALVDDEDYERVNKWKWQYHRAGYAARSVKVNRKSTAVLMHRLIMDTPHGLFTDHKDHNRLNNQKSNLRICTYQENSWNKTTGRRHSFSQFKGVCFSFMNNTQYYRTEIRVDGKTITRYFPFTPQGEIQAAIKYNELAQKHYGEFAYLNIIPV